MVAGSNQVISVRVRKIIQSIKEIVGNHSDADIYAVLKESNMDPNETAQKLLNQDPFHEVRRKRDKKKELTGHRGLEDNRRHVDHNVQPGRHVEHHVPPERHVEHHVPPGRHVEHHVQPWRHVERHVQPGGQVEHHVQPGRQVEHHLQRGRHMEHHVVQPGRHVERNAPPEKSHTGWDRNARRGGYIRNSLPDAGIHREFRIVRDNRVKQNVSRDVKPESVQHLASGEGEVKIDTPEKSVDGSLDKKHLTFNRSEGSRLPPRANRPRDSLSDGSGHKEDVVQGGSLRPPPVEKTLPAATVTNLQAREVRDNSKVHSTSTSSSSVIGVYSSSSDPVHVPSPASRSAGTVGAIRREVGVVGLRKQSSNHAANLAVSNSFSVPLLAKDVSSLPESPRQSVVTSKSSQLNQAASDRAMPNPANRSPLGNQHSSKMHQQPTGHQKAMQSTMEWKPKSSQKAAIISTNTSGTTSAPTLHTDNSSNSKPVDVANFPEVIIPEHLRVPDSERTQLTFGSFGAGFDSTKISSSVSHAFESVEQLIDGHSTRLFPILPKPQVCVRNTMGNSNECRSASVPVGSIGNASGEDQVSDYQATSRSDSPASAAESEQAPPGNESLDHQNIDNYADIGLVQGHSPSYTSSHSHHLQTSTSLPSFSEYDPQKSYDRLPFLRTVMEDHSDGQGIASSTEAISSHATNSSPPSTVTFSQQQQSQQHQQQQQALANMYSQVHISHFPNFMPYRHMFSPVYVPPMAMPNYSSNPAYPHPSNASSYLLMPGGNSHLTGGGMKYAASQFKPVPAGSPTTYGSYANPTGFAITPPGNVGGATGLEDATRIKYKDNNLYVPNPQAETSDIWIQPPRELPTMQSAPYYNLPAQPPHPAAAPAFVPTSACCCCPQSTHVQYPGLYHPPASPAPIAGPHHLVHQSGLGGSISGVGVAGGAAAPGPQVGAYQQTQLGHLNWPANF
ncbi:LOW QUALITY PROTEIN: uncharacterized protein LOC109851226 [Asparagus officinalis]|uniref:LOW QUALITY PROTEIN: uncharacterized protein LOC109851226 n=1 Tax=Asparagus officinalis TaxID=4686 RepID=UPI00098E3BFB|nr:LOW QUALITY PROTEIN: uncharacterized protein LOC109851226 [Asparagus officinalis]